MIDMLDIFPWEFVLLALSFVTDYIYYSQFNTFLQGSVLQIQGPRGSKGSKGEAVRSFIIFAIWFRLNTIQNHFICSYEGNCTQPVTTQIDKYTNNK